jgi:hypothetical protein
MHIGSNIGMFNFNLIEKLVINFLKKVIQALKNV